MEMADHSPLAIMPSQPCLGLVSHLLPRRFLLIREATTQTARVPASCRRASLRPLRTLSTLDGSKIPLWGHCSLNAALSANSHQDSPTNCWNHAALVLQPLLSRCW